MQSLLSILKNPNNWGRDYLWSYWTQKSTGRLYKSASWMPEAQILILFAVDEFSRPTHSHRGFLKDIMELFEIAECSPFLT